VCGTRHGKLVVCPRIASETPHLRSPLPHACQARPALSSTFFRGAAAPAPFSAPSRCPVAASRRGAAPGCSRSGRARGRRRDEPLAALLPTLLRFLSQRVASASRGGASDDPARARPPVGPVIPGQTGALLAVGVELLQPATYLVAAT